MTPKNLSKIPMAGGRGWYDRVRGEESEERGERVGREEREEKRENSRQRRKQVEGTALVLVWLEQSVGTRLSAPNA